LDISKSLSSKKKEKDEDEEHWLLKRILPRQRIVILEDCFETKKGTLLKRTGMKSFQANQPRQSTCVTKDPFQNKKVVIFELPGTKGLNWCSI
jgi:hypothetical protein